MRSRNMIQCTNEAPGNLACKYEIKAIYPITSMYSTTKKEVYTVSYGHSSIPSTLDIPTSWQIGLLA